MAATTMSSLVHESPVERLVVKHTFWNLIDDQQGTVITAPARTRSFSDSVVLSFDLFKGEAKHLSDQETATDGGSEDFYLTDDEDNSSASIQNESIVTEPAAPEPAIPEPGAPAPILQHGTLMQPNWLTIVRPTIIVYEASHTPEVQEHAEEKTSRRRRQRNRGKNKSKQDKLDESKEDSRTTVMLRNLPRDFSRQMLLDLLDQQGFNARYNFVYIPIDFVRHACLGYAFVNLTSPDVVAEFWQAFDGFKDWCVPCQKTCRVHWSTPHQGFQAHVDRYRNSPLMHESVVDEIRPVMFVDGVRVPFAPPTKSLRAPRLRASRQRCPFWNHADGLEEEIDESLDVDSVSDDYDGLQQDLEA